MLLIFWSVPVRIDEQRFTETARSFGQCNQLVSLKNKEAIKD